MSFYNWITIINFLAIGYLFLLFLELCHNIILCIRKYYLNPLALFKDIALSFKTTYGLGTLSVVPFTLAFIWLSQCDNILQLLNLPAWSNGDTGHHIGSCYSLIFFIPAFILSYKFKKDFAAKLFMKLSGVFSFSYTAILILFIIY